MNAHPDRSVRATSVAAALFLTLAAGMVTGCRNPLYSTPGDYDRRVNLSRLRNVESLNLEAATTPGPLASVDDPVQAVRDAFEGREHVELTIEQIRAATLENNLDLQVALINPTIAAQQVSAEEGAFEALIFANASFSQTDNPTILATQASGAEFLSVNPGARLPLRSGGTAEIAFPFTRNDTNNQFNLLNPAYTQDMELSLSQPLLRGAGRRANTAAIRIADLSRQQSEARTKLEVINQISAADRAYWRLYAASQALLVRYEGYELAVEQLERARREVRAGRQAEIEITRAESGVADRIEQIITAQTDVLLAQRELKRIANIPGLDVSSPVNLVAMTDPDPVRYDLDGAALAGQAMTSRMDLLELELRIAAEEVTEALRRNEALPLLNASFLYRINGLGAEFSEAVRVAEENRFEDWTIGLNAEIPLGNETAEARIRQAVLTRLQSIASRNARRQAITQEVLDAVDQLDSGWQRILAARQAVALAARTFAAEQRQFDAGRNTTNEVLEADVALSEARLTEIQAVVDYQISQIDLSQATGTLLGQAKVGWEPVDPRDWIDEDKRLPGVPRLPEPVSDAGMSTSPPAENTAAEAESDEG